MVKFVNGIKNKIYKMEKQFIYNGKTYQRDSENVGGDVQSVKWFEVSNDSLKEVYDIDFVERLETFYEASLIESIIPKPFYI